MQHVAIGITIHDDPARLNATLASLPPYTAPLVERWLLPDGPDAATLAALATYPNLPQLGTAAPQGAAACLNRLAQASDAPVLVLLEGGTQLGPGALEILLAALDTDPQNGLAGPSTNRAWNEQGAFPHAAGGPDEIARTAAQARQRFGTATRLLEPLYSLADFCYVVRREVITAIGAADEGYGVGPCWEMDYNIRAARAGWRGVWACAAYVYRPPSTPWRQEEEQRRFAASRRRYQDRFCALRLRGEKADYEPHCRGDACPHFAPLALIPLRQPFPAPPGLDGPGAPTWPPPDSAPAELLASAVAPALHLSLGGPLVSCIMPTYNRRAFVPQAIRYFLRQDYPHCELVIVDDGTDPVADCIPDDPRIRYLRLDGRQTIGAKRNRACAEAHGDIIVHWDDDDWYPPWRVRVQVAALRDRLAAVCGSSQVYYYEPATGRGWQYAYTGGRRPWVVGGTLAYHKTRWARSPFPDLQVGEDTRLVWHSATEEVCDLADPTLCIGLLHPANSSPKQTGGPYWQPLPLDPIYAALGADRAFYETAPTLPALPGGTEGLPLVSCIMPTYNRRAFIPLALESFHRQDYPNRELIVVDDGTDPVGDLCLGQPDVHYLRYPARLSIGGKRNLACAEAAGTIIAHWDDDDWYAPDRLRRQAAPILAGEADLTGLENAFVLQLPAGVFWATHPTLHQQMFVGDVHGGTLVYDARLLDEGLAYPEVNLAEDADLIRQAVGRGKRLARLANAGVFIYMRHGRNAWRFTPGLFLDPAGWHQIAAPPTFPPTTLARYQAAARTGSGRVFAERV